MEITLTGQEVELIQTLIKPIAEDDGNSNFTRKVAANILLKLIKLNNE